ncbi:MAG: PrpF domain-containing protein, partial [Dehalococcoidia bacterium]
LAAVTVATACVIPGTTADGLAEVPEGARKLLLLEHPTGDFAVEVEVSGAGAETSVDRAALLRTARPLMEGNILVPGNVWDGKKA